MDVMRKLLNESHRQMTEKRNAHLGLIACLRCKDSVPARKIRIINREKYCLSCAEELFGQHKPKKQARKRRAVH